MNIITEKVKMVNGEFTDPHYKTIFFHTTL